MTYQDARVGVTCDGHRCMEEIEVDPPFTYPNMSGKGGSYDTRDHTLDPLVEDEGWTIDDEKHFCESCSEERTATKAGQSVVAILE